MQISVWDTYVKRDDNKVMHFDILVPLNEDASKVFSFGNIYLEEKPFKTNSLSVKECKLCHMKEATIEIIEDINNKGFSILELENCH